MRVKWFIEYTMLRTSAFLLHQLFFSMNRKAAFFLFVSFLAALNLGTVRKSEDPIRDTQTNPILYEQKKEEEKDGKKGPLLYHVRNYPRESFFIDPPLVKEKKNFPEKIVTEKAPSSVDTAGWWEEQPTASPAVLPGETVSEPSSEPLGETEKVQDQEASEPSAVVPEAENAPSGQKDDYWW